MWVWNGNQASEPSAGIGAKDVTVEYSTDGTTWTALAGVPQFAQATGEPNYVHNTTVDFRRCCGQVRQADHQEQLGRPEPSNTTSARSGSSMCPCRPSSPSLPLELRAWPWMRS